MYFDSNVQRQYEEAHPHSPIPVLLNDVFFAVHALIACILTAAQCLIYEHGNQRISHTCIIISAAMIVGAIVTAVITTLGFINMLFFITTLSYIKMIVTLLKYIPQAVQNFRRQSTTGWSIGNVLLDFMGGCLDILQMCLQCWNVDDWSAFYGNPVKFGLGLVSTLFDILFITQHYILYRDKDRSSNIKKSCHLTAGISENEDFDCEQENDVQSSKRSCDDKSLSQNKNDS
ncbi:Lysosomal Cystine Transporter [Dictyocaulus viviparus]|uniref:Lysosomal Cystine Transporter n=1 Tax=Dictyocaulus viviparus TaxID=29172 RepID=A0A0D8XZU9_DICVI|nr:Lysosomal Cystine Transporter [Dictyocaulus viviparus]